MGKMGGKRTLKRTMAPEFWPIRRKEYKWVAKPTPGAHKQDESVTVLVALRDMLQVVESSREAKILISLGKVFLNNRRVSDLNQPLGLFDLLTVSGKFFRFLPRLGGYTLHEINQEDASATVLRVENKTCLRHSIMQLNLSGGYNLRVDKDSPYFSVGTLDSLRLDSGQKKVLDHLPLAKGSYVLVTKGKNSGVHGSLSEIIPSFKRRNSLVRITTVGGRVYETILDYIVAIGKDRPVLSLPEGDGL